MKRWAFGWKAQVTTSQNSSFSSGFTTPSSLSGQCLIFKHHGKGVSLDCHTSALEVSREMREIRKAKAGQSWQVVSPVLHTIKVLPCLAFTPEDTSSRGVSPSEVLASEVWTTTDKFSKKRGGKEGVRTCLNCSAKLMLQQLSQSPLLQTTVICLPCHLPVLSSLVFSRDFSHYYESILCFPQ